MATIYDALEFMASTGQIAVNAGTIKVPSKLANDQAKEDGSEVDTPSKMAQKMGKVKTKSVDDLKVTKLTKKMGKDVGDKGKIIEAGGPGSGRKPGSGSNLLKGQNAFSDSLKMARKHARYSDTAYNRSDRAVAAGNTAKAEQYRKEGDMHVKISNSFARSHDSSSYDKSKKHYDKAKALKTKHNL